MNERHQRFDRLAGSRIPAVRLERSLLLGDAEMVDRLLDKGGDRLVRKYRLCPPLLAAICPAAAEKTDEIRERLVRRLLGAGADPNVSKGGMTPLLLAARFGTAWIIDALLAAGAEAHRLDHQGRNALHHAAEGGQSPAVVARLVAAGVAVDANEFHSGLTPLGIYAMQHEPEACRVLLAAGADPNARVAPLDISPREAAHSIESPTMIGILDEPCKTALLRLGARVPANRR